MRDADALKAARAERLAHQLVGPPFQLRFGRRAAKPRPHGVRGPLPDALGADQVCVAAAAAPHRRSEQAERAQAMRLVDREPHAGRAAILRADQMTGLDLERVEEAPDVGSKLGGAPAVVRRLGRFAEPRQIRPDDAIVAREMRNPAGPGARGLGITVNHHHGLGRRSMARQTNGPHRPSTPRGGSPPCAYCRCVPAPRDFPFFCYRGKDALNACGVLALGQDAFEIANDGNPGARSRAMLRSQ